MSDESEAPVVTFVRLVPEAIAPMRAEASALGQLPTAAFKYCEALRTASSFGWYLFPPKEVRLRSDGSEIFWWTDEGGWQLLESAHYSEDFVAAWQERAPRDLFEMAPPFVTALASPGVVQVWTGFLASTAPGWSLAVRAPVNIVGSRALMPYEGIIETDTFGPCPVFINMRVAETGRDILLSPLKPLMQVQPIHRDCMSANVLRGFNFRELVSEDGGSTMVESDWDGLRLTVTPTEPRERTKPVGRYAVSTRRRRRAES